MLLLLWILPLRRWDDSNSLSLIGGVKAHLVVKVDHLRYIGLTVALLLVFS